MTTGTSATPGRPVDPLVAALAAMPDAVSRLLLEHEADAGGRCRLCGLGGQAGAQRWPCRLRELAGAAYDLIHRHPRTP